MAYATASDVASLNRARVPGQGNNPTWTDVQTYANMASAELDAILINKGYQVPVSSQYTGAWNLLNSLAATGGWAKMEAAAPQSPNVDRAEKAWDDAKEMLRTAQSVMDAPKDEQRAAPRGPWVTMTPSGEDYDPVLDVINGTTGDGISGGGCNSRKNPFFVRNQRFRMRSWPPPPLF